MSLPWVRIPLSPPEIRSENKAARPNMARRFVIQERASDTLLSRLPAERRGDFGRDQLDRFERFLERRQAWLHLANEIGRFAKQRLLFEAFNNIFWPSPVDVVVLDLFVDGHRGELGTRRCRRFKTGFDIAIGDVWITGRIDGA